MALLALVFPYVCSTDFCLPEVTEGEECYNNFSCRLDITLSFCIAPLPRVFSTLTYECVGVLEAEPLCLRSCFEEEEWRDFFEFDFVFFISTAQFILFNIILPKFCS